MRILVVEDDPGIARGLATALRQRGYAADICNSIAAGWAALGHERFDALVLDRGLVDGEGMELVRRLRATKGVRDQGGVSLPDAHMPILIITARDEVEQRIEGLDLGADDYLIKPFDFNEFEARLRALLRRSAGRAQPLVRYADIELDPAAHTVHRAGRLIDIAPREFAVLLLLLESRGRVLSRQQIEQRLYSWNDTVGSNAIEVHIHHLRRKLGASLVQTMRGVGYFIPREPE